MRKKGRRGEKRAFIITLITFISAGAIFSSASFADVSPGEVLVLVNENSPTSNYIAKMYRQYYPDIAESQVLCLTGLADCSGPSSTSADEIITREQYNQYIAGPVRAYLSDANYPDRITQIRVIITTAGMPYRIEDQMFPNVIRPGGSNPDDVLSRESSIDAASVESELSCLWYSEYGDNPFGIKNRMVNPYQGYRASGVELFEKTAPGTKTFNWTIGISQRAPIVQNTIMEGTLLPPMPPYTFYYGPVDRSFNAGDIYLVSRLDGPKNQGKSAVFGVREMLERAKRASNPAIGVNPLSSVVVIDDSPTLTGFDKYDNNRTFNLDYGVDYWIYDAQTNQPPDADQARERADYQACFSQLTESDPINSGLNIGYLELANDNLCIFYDCRADTLTSQADLDDRAVLDANLPQYQGVIGLATFGRNAEESNPSNYLLTQGPDGSALFNTINGAVFTSMESFNAVTMFSDVSTGQGKIIDFISIKGTAAIGHSFEPQPDAAVDNEFLFYNLLADHDLDGVADLTFIEAAYTAIPYLSWSEVVIGDPLMKIAYGPGSKPWSQLYGDVNNDGRVNYADVWYVKAKMGGTLNTQDPQAFDLYNDLYDVNKDGRINFADVWYVKTNLGAVADL